MPGVPDVVLDYAGVAKYLIPRLPTQGVLDQWNLLSPPTGIQDAHEQFATSMQDVIVAHHAFNEAAFKRSDASPKSAGETLELVLQSHLQLQEDVEQQLDQFLLTEYRVSLSEIPEIVVPLQP